MSLKINIQKKYINAKIPTRATEGSAGMDLYACLKEDATIEPGKIFLIPTGISISLSDPEYAAFLYSRSGLSSKYGICLANGVGVIDNDYRGEILVALLNTSSNPYTIKNGDRIAQMVIKQVAIPKICEVDSLPETKRSHGGFGSTGK